MQPVASPNGNAKIITVKLSSKWQTDRPAWGTLKQSDGFITPQSCLLFLCIFSQNKRTHLIILSEKDASCAERLPSECVILKTHCFGVNSVRSERSPRAIWLMRCVNLYTSQVFPDLSTDELFSIQNEWMRGDDRQTSREVQKYITSALVYFQDKTWWLEPLKMEDVLFFKPAWFIMNKQRNSQQNRWTQ